jgi:hypothetical protein
MHADHRRAQEQYDLARSAVYLAQKEELQAWKTLLRWEALERAGATTISPGECHGDAPPRTRAT